ncbi:MAG: NACHT domain-containing protein [Anaerolineales bacterium]|jgi:energy-coupling factor transporter ATP-binding protein EcfA2
MSTSDQFLLALQAYQEIQAELHQDKQPRPESEQTSKAEASVVQATSLPAGSLLLGLAEDGLPVLLDLYNPVAGPLLVAGDRGSGKTVFLQSLARLSNHQDSSDVSFGVLTPFPEEWTALEALPGCLGVWPAYHPSAHDFLSQLVSWADALPKTRQAVLLLFDGFDLMTGSDDQSQHDLRWLLMYGPERQVWPVITLNPARLMRLRTWMDYFHTRVLGQVKHAHNARSLVDDPKVGLGDLLPGKQFCLSQSGSWLKFWLPPFGQGV